MAQKCTMQVYVIEIASLFIICCVVFALYGSLVVNSIVSVILAIFTYRSSKKYLCSGKIETHNKAVLITGCDSGFGNHLAKKLDSRGFQVFASCLFPEGAGANDLKQTCSSRLKVLQLDVTKEESVANALIFVKDNLGSNEFWALVNNAGLFRGFSVEFSTVQNFEDTFDVNALGPVRLTKVFLPLLKKSKGRVINMASGFGRLIVADICGYVMSKHALVAFSRCLSLEMIPWGVRVISIEPEVFSTPIVDHDYVSKVFEDTIQEMDEDVISSYGEKYLKRWKKIFRKYSYISCNKIDIVANDIQSAICDRNPKNVYRSSRNLFVLLGRYLLENVPSVLYDKIYMIGMKLVGHPIYNVKVNCNS